MEMGRWGVTTAKGSVADLWDRIDNPFIIRRSAVLNAIFNAVYLMLCVDGIMPHPKVSSLESGCLRLVLIEVGFMCPANNPGEHHLQVV